MFSINKPIVISRTMPYLPHGHNLNKLGKGPLCDYTYQISSPRLGGFREDFMFSLYKPIYNMRLSGGRGGSFLAPGV